MATYCAFTADHRPLLDSRAVVLVRDGFSWPAALFGPVWALAHGLWFTALGLAGLALGLAVLIVEGPARPATGAAIGVAAALFVGFHAADLRAHALARRGYRVDDTLVAPGEDEAERRYFARRRLGGDPA